MRRSIRSRASIPWTEEGFASQALHCLLCVYEVFAGDRHRALADCEAGVWLLAQRSPFESKELLRARGHRWMPEIRNGIERSWWTDVEPDQVELDLEWFRKTVYGGAWGYLLSGGVPWRRVSAFNRWRDDPSDCTLPPFAA